MEFKIGDKVKAIKSVDGFSALIGKKGRVVCITKGINPIGIEFEESFDDGHDCNGSGKCGFCRYGKEECFELLETYQKEFQKNQMEKKVYSVLAIDKKTGKKVKDEVVVAENEKNAILKAFECDVENLFIKTTEEGSFKEEKPVEAVLVKEAKK